MAQPGQGAAFPRARTPDMLRSKQLRLAAMRSYYSPADPEAAIGIQRQSPRGYSPTLPTRPATASGRPVGRMPHQQLNTTSPSSHRPVGGSFDRQLTVPVPGMTTRLGMVLRAQPAPLSRDGAKEWALTTSKWKQRREFGGGRAGQEAADALFMQATDIDLGGIDVAHVMSELSERARASSAQSSGGRRRRPQGPPGPSLRSASAVALLPGTMCAASHTAPQSLRGPTVSVSGAASCLQAHVE